MSRRTAPVVDFAQRPSDGPLRRIQDVLQALLGKVVSFSDVLLLSEPTGFVFTNAPAGSGAVFQQGAVYLDLSDAGVDQCRLVLRGDAGAAGTVQATVHDRTNNVELCRVGVTSGTTASYAGNWTTIKPPGADQECELRIIGDGVLDPVIYRASLQLRTNQARA